MQINKRKKKKCCKVGKCSVDYIYIIITAFLFLLKNSLLSLKDLELEDEKNLFGINTVVYKHGLIKLFIEYMGFIIFGAIFLLIFRKNTEEKHHKNNELDISESKSGESEINKNQQKSSMYLIYTGEDVFNKSPKNLLIACGVFAFQLTIRSILMNLNLWIFDLWIFNIIFISIFLKKIFKYNIYKHHIFIFIFNFVINFVFMNVASCIGKNDYEKVNETYGSYAYNFLFYLVYLILSCMLSFSQVLQKKVMDFEYKSPSTVVFMYGVISTFFILIALIVSTFVPCRGSSGIKELCPINKSDSKINDDTYLDNFSIFFDNLGDKYHKNEKEFFLEILLLYPLYSFIGFLKYFCETMIVYRLNPIYVLISDNIFYNSKKIVRLVNKPKEIKTYLRLAGEMIALFAYFFFLEFFEFNCCGLNFNTKSNIDKRSRMEAINLNSTEIDDGRTDSFTSYSNCSRIDLQNDDDNKQDNQEEMLKEGEKNN